MADSFKISWKNPLNNYKYELLIYKKGTTAITHSYNGIYNSYYPTSVTEIEEGTLKELKLDWSYDNNYPYGMPTAINLKITFNLDNTNNTEFKTTLLYPIQDYENTISLNTLANDFSFNYKYKISNVFRLFCDFGDGNYFDEIYIGLQKSGLGGNFKLSTGELNIDCFDINRCILESLNLSFLRELNKSNLYISKQVYFDWIYRRSDGNWFATVNFPAADMNNKENAYFWFYGFSLVFTFISEVCKNVGQLLTRMNQFNYSLEIDMPLYYKQMYNTLDTNVGDQINQNDLFVIGFVSDKATYSGAKFYGGLFYNSIETEYKTLWDYLKEFAIDNGFKYFFKVSDSTYTLKAYKMTSSSTVFNEFEAINSIYDIDIKPDYEILKKVETASQETIGQDISKVEQTNNSSRSEKSINLVVIHNTVPNAYDGDKNWKILTNKFVFNPFDFNYSTDNPVDIRYSWQNKIKGLFYFDTPSVDGLEITTSAQVIRVHSYVIYDFGLFDSGNSLYFPYTPIDLSSISDEPPGTAEAITFQNNQSKAIALTKTLLRVFSDDKQLGISAKSTLGAFYDNECYWLNPYRALQIDYTEIHNGDLLVDYKDRFYLTKCEIDILSDEVSFDGITIFGDIL